MCRPLEIATDSSSSSLNVVVVISGARLPVVVQLDLEGVCQIMTGEKDKADYREVV